MNERAALVLAVVFGGSVLGIAVQSARADASAAASSGIRIQLDRPPGGLKARFQVTGLEAPSLRALSGAPLTADKWNDVFAVYVVPAAIVAEIDTPPMLGEHRVSGDTVEFEPSFPLQPGLKYRAVFRPAKIPGSASGGPVSAEFIIPARPVQRTTVVEHVYPSADVLPENQLKFYLHFSAPMSRGGSYRHIHLLNQAGREVELPFLELDEELWDPEGFRLTLFIDPGRVKREVKPLEEIGPAIEAGKTYTLVIDADWRDAENNALKEGFRKTFRASPPDRTSPDPKLWKMTVPKGGGNDAFVLDFPEPLDHALMQRMIRVKDADGEIVPGRIAISNHEQRWAFTPSAPWRGGKYSLTVETLLEDLAGNSVGKPFEVDIFGAVERQAKREMVSLPFVIRGR
ncbi:MAG: hypothetical protein AB1705_22030 [Verrucomicrobiota bacterium]